MPSPALFSRLLDIPVEVVLRFVPGFDFWGTARVSLSGTPASQPGDWFGTAIVRPAENDAISLAIDTRVE